MQNLSSPNLPKPQQGPSQGQYSSSNTQIHQNKPVVKAPPSSYNSGPMQYPQYIPVGPYDQSMLKNSERSNNSNQSPSGYGKPNPNSNLYDLSIPQINHDGNYEPVFTSLSNRNINDLADAPQINTMGLGNHSPNKMNNNNTSARIAEHIVRSAEKSANDSRMKDQDRDLKVELEVSEVKLNDLSKRIDECLYSSKNTLARSNKISKEASRLASPSRSESVSLHQSGLHHPGNNSNYLQGALSSDREHHNTSPNVLSGSGDRNNYLNEAPGVMPKFNNRVDQILNRASELNNSNANQNSVINATNQSSPQGSIRIATFSKPQSPNRIIDTQVLYGSSDKKIPFERSPEPIGQPKGALPIGSMNKGGQNKTQKQQPGSPTRQIVYDQVQNNAPTETVKKSSVPQPSNASKSGGNKPATVSNANTAANKVKSSPQKNSPVKSTSSAGSPPTKKYQSKTASQGTEDAQQYPQLRPPKKNSPIKASPNKKSAAKPPPKREYEFGSDTNLSEAGPIPSEDVSRRALLPDPTEMIPMPRSLSPKRDNNNRDSNSNHPPTRPSHEQQGGVQRSPEESGLSHPTGSFKNVGENQTSGTNSQATFHPSNRANQQIPSENPHYGAEGYNINPHQHVQIQDSKPQSSDGRKSFGNKDFARVDAFSFADPNSNHPTMRNQAIEGLIKDENKFRTQEHDKRAFQESGRSLSPIEPRTPVDVKTPTSTNTMTPLQDHTKINPALLSSGKHDDGSGHKKQYSKATSDQQLRDLIGGSSHTPEPRYIDPSENKSGLSFDSNLKIGGRLNTEEFKNAQQNATMNEGSRLDRSGFRSQNLSKLGLDKSSFEEQLESSFSKAYVSRKNRILNEVQGFDERMESDIYYRRKFHQDLERFMNDFKPKMTREEAEDLYNRLAEEGRKRNMRSQKVEFQKEEEFKEQYGTRSIDKESQEKLFERLNKYSKDKQQHQREIEMLKKQQEEEELKKYQESKNKAKMSKEYENHLVTRLTQDAERRRIDHEAILRKKAEHEIIELNQLQNQKFSSPGSRHAKPRYLDPKGSHYKSPDRTNQSPTSALGKSIEFPYSNEEKPAVYKGHASPPQKNKVKFRQNGKEIPGSGTKKTGSPNVKKTMSRQLGSDPNIRGYPYKKHSFLLEDENSQFDQQQYNSNDRNTFNESVEELLQPMPREKAPLRTEESRKSFEKPKKSLSPQRTSGQQFKPQSPNRYQDPTAEYMQTLHGHIQAYEQNLQQHLANQGARGSPQKQPQRADKTPTRTQQPKQKKAPKTISSVSSQGQLSTKNDALSSILYKGGAPPAGSSKPASKKNSQATTPSNAKTHKKTNTNSSVQSKIDNKPPQVSSDKPKAGFQTNLKKGSKAKLEQEKQRKQSEAGQGGDAGHGQIPGKKQRFMNEVDAINYVNDLIEKFRSSSQVGVQGDVANYFQQQQ